MASVPAAATLLGSESLFPWASLCLSVPFPTRLCDAAVRALAEALLVHRHGKGRGKAGIAAVPGDAKELLCVVFNLQV